MTHSGKRSFLPAIEIGILTLILLFFTGAVWYLNCHVTPSMYISDMYADVEVAVQMWQHRSFFPENWVFGNQVYLCATPALASAFYGLTGEPFLSMGYAAFAMTLVQLLCLYYMVCPVFPDLRQRLLCLSLYLALPALTGDVVRGQESWQLLFTMCAYYGCYTATAFLCIGLWLRGDRNPPLLLLAACGLAFATGLQSLRQTLIMTLPLMAAEALCWLFLPCHRNGRRTRLALWLCGANLLGVLGRRFLTYRRHEIYGSSRLLTPDRIPEAIGESLRNLAGLLLPDGKASLLIALLLAAGILFCFLLAIGKTHRHSPDSPRSLLLLVLLCSVGAMFGVDMLTRIAVRSVYYFMLFPLLAVLLVCLSDSLGRLGRTTAVLLTLLVLLPATLPQILPPCRQTLYRMQEPEWAVSRELLAGDFTTVYSHWNGCEDLAAASNGSLKAGYWIGEDTPFQTPVTWLCDPDIFATPAEASVFVFYGEAERDSCLEALENAHISAQLLLSYYSERRYEEVYLYRLSENILTAYANP